MRMMKRIAATFLIAFAMIMAAMPVTKVPCQAKSKKAYWISGYGGEGDDEQKQIKAVYKGYKIRISGYGYKGKSKFKKLKPKTYKVSKKCKVYFGGVYKPISYKKMLKKYGRKGKLILYIDIKIKNGKVVLIDCAA